MTDLQLGVSFLLAYKCLNAEIWSVCLEMQSIVSWKATHAGTAGVMMEGSEASLPSLSRYVFSPLTIRLVVILVGDGGVNVW